MGQFLNLFLSLCIYVSMYILSVQLLSRVRLFVTPWTIAHQALLSMGFSRQEYWSGFPYPPPAWSILSSSSSSSQPRDQTQVSWIAGRFFTILGSPKLHIVVVQSLSHVRLFVPHGMQHTSLPCPSLSPGVSSDSCPLSQ